MEDPSTAAPISLSFSLYACRLCPRTFSTTQALGGHQTAHRKEKIERLARAIREAEIDELKYAADNDVVLSPEPISWAPPDTDDDQTFKVVYDFMPMPSSGSEGCLESGSLGVGSSGSSENKASHETDQKKKQRKRKLKVYNFMPMGNATSPGSGSVEGLESGNKVFGVDEKKKKQKQKKHKVMNSSGCSEINVAPDADQKKQKKRKYSTKLTCNAEKTEKKSRRTNLRDCSENKTPDLEKKKKQIKKRKSTELSEYCSEDKASSTENKKPKFMKSSKCSEIEHLFNAYKKKREITSLSEVSNNKASEADQNKSQFTKLMPSPELTLATGAAPDLLVEGFMSTVESNGNECTEF